MKDLEQSIEMNSAIQGGQLMAKSNVSWLVEGRAMVDLGNDNKSAQPTLEKV